MAIKKLEPVLTSFTPDGDYLAISSSNEIKIWNTHTGGLLAEWKPSENLSGTSFTCMACSHIGKKRKKERELLLAVGTDAGETLIVDASTGERKWISTRCQPEGIAALYFANRGRSLYVIGTNGMASEMKSESGELVQELKVSRAPISLSACSSDERILAIGGAETRVVSLENAKKLLKFGADSSPVEYISVSDKAKAIVTSGSGKRDLQVWNCDLTTKAVSRGHVLSMKHSPIFIECKESCNGEDGLVVLSVSSRNVAYVWNLSSSSHEQINPTKVSVKDDSVSAEKQSGRKSCKNHISIIAAKLHTLESGGRATALITYGSIDSPQFSVVDISNAGEEIVLTARDESTKNNTEAVQENVQENGIVAENGLNEDLEAVAVPIKKKKANKKRAASDLDLEDAEKLVDNGHGMPLQEVELNDDLNEPTIGEKLANINLVDDNEGKILEKQESSPHIKPPSADSVHVLLKQALHADDRTQLLNCVYTQDEKVIANSVSALSSSYVLKLLESLVSLIHSRGAVLACALPWLRSLLLQHSSVIISQESSLRVLNSLYQIIESRVSSCQPALQLSSCLDLLYAGTVEDDAPETEAITPIIFQDTDESDDEEESEDDDAMETDQDNDDNEPRALADDAGEIEDGTDVSDVDD